MISTDPYNLQRFLEAQSGTFATAFAELTAGRKQSHWMWFIFPQIAGLGRSSTAKYYALVSFDEARAYREHPVLGDRLDACVHAILGWAGRRTAEEILGPVDAIKLRSSLTLFDAVDTGTLFEDAINAFFDCPDEQTIALLGVAR